VPAVSQSPSYRVKVYEAVSRLLVQLRDYASLETYLRETYQQFEQEGLFAKTAPEMRFNMLTYLINTLYFSEKYQSSLEYAHVLGQWLQEYTGPSLMKYRFFYHNSLVINYSKLDPRRAIAELEPLRADSLWQAEPYYRLFVSSNLVLLFFNTRQFPKAMRELARLYTDDRYPSLDEALRFRLQLTELFIRYETEELELLLKQHERLSKQFAHLLLPHTREAALLDGLLLLARADTPKARKKAKPKLAALVAQLAGEVKPETDLLDFHEWFSRRL
jgi:hypothetical protein